ncbi:MAG: zinc-binding dehydrogenase, partial [Gemmatimonadales bacterium]|nr:zinc-binding dehydrogenase [Gemmatimonadales bacterium]
DPVLSAPSDVLVQVNAAALNRLDLFVVGGLPHTSPSWPHILGSDAVGVVAAVGPAVTGLRPGDRVIVNPGISCRSCPACQAGEQPYCRQYRILGEHLPGTLAERVVVPAANLRPAPPAFSDPEAAAFGLATLTAWRMLMTRAALRSGETVLVWGAGGGVAQASIQIARWAGARVLATSSSDAKLALATRLGATTTFRHDQVDVAREVRALTGVGVDVVVDTVGEATWASSLRALRPGGRLVTCGATTGPQVGLDLRKLFWFQWSLLGSTMGTDAEFDAIVQLAHQGELRPVVDSVVPLAEATTALARLAAGAQAGKLVIEVAA